MIVRIDKAATEAKNVPFLPMVALEMLYLDVSRRYQLRLGISSPGQ